MKNRICMIALTLVSCHSHAYDPGAELDSLEAKRRANHATTTQALSDLNYLRMKILAVGKSIKGFKVQALQIAQDCGSDFERASNCRDLASVLYGDIENELFKVRQLQGSDKYQSILNQPAAKKTEFAQLMDAQRERLFTLSSKVFELRKSAGATAARLDFERTQAKLAKSKADFAHAATCKLSWPTAQTLYVSAMSDLRSADSKVDPFLIARAQRKAQEIGDTIKTLNESCPEIETGELKSKLVVFEQKDLSQKMADLFDKACAKLNTQDREMLDVCRLKIRNESTYYSIHRLLEAPGVIR